MLSLHRLFREDAGQDILEYALLTGTIGLGAAAAISLVGDAIGSSYAIWDSNAQSDALVEVPDPAGAP
jgi:Flp pilus assembly pilin Flp